MLAGKSRNSARSAPYIALPASAYMDRMKVKAIMKCLISSPATRIDSVMIARRGSMWTKNCMHRSACVTSMIEQR
eukprot:COSAG04_NODE_545_length_12819_cov_3.351179_4_plen_75_part_00